MNSKTHIDKNFKVTTNIKEDNIIFYNDLEEPYKIYGVFMENNKFRRLPKTVAERVNQGVKILHSNTAGRRVRFVTDSAHVAIAAKMDNIGKMPHFALTGSAGFDMYEKTEAGEKYVQSFVPP